MQPTTEPRLVPNSGISKPAGRSESVSNLFAVDFVSVSPENLCIFCCEGINSLCLYRSLPFLKIILFLFLFKFLPTQPTF